MSERHGIGDLARDVKVSLAKYLAGVTVVRVPLDVHPKTLAVGFEMESGTVHQYFSFNISTQKTNLDIGARTSVRLEGFAPVEVKVPVYFESSVTEVFIFTPDRTFTHRIPPFETTPEVSILDNIGIESRSGHLFFQAIDIPDKIERVNCEIGHTVERLAGFALVPRSIADYERAYRLPVSKSPTSWDRLDRKFIVQSWDRLVERAKLKLGSNPGRDLEMLAIFMEVDFSCFRKVLYDRSSGKLRMFPHRPGSRTSLKRSKYAIIIGALKSTGTVLQVAMPLDG